MLTEEMKMMKMMKMMAEEKEEGDEDCDDDDDDEDANEAEVMADSWRNEYKGFTLHAASSSSSSSASENNRSSSGRPNIPVYIGGLGFGALVASACAHENRHMYAGLVALSPHAETDTLEGWSSVMCLLSFLSPCLRMWGTSHTLLKHSRNLAVGKALQSDPLVVLPTWRTAREIRLLTRRVISIIPKLRVPLLYMQGLQDLIADPQGSIIWHGDTQALTGRLKDIVLMKNGWHNILLEPEHEHVIDRMVTWITRDLELRLLQRTLD
mmetsp:Transcript_11428/g.22446  ORF Transcript_11428/g.22446 Transcript_11428/m.22446 type:complete len:267 (-) Transcript_11428:192-992(-)